MAIDSYRSMDLNSETYTSEIGEGWKRALALSNVDEDYIEAYVPVSLLGRVSEQTGVIRVREIIPPEATQIAPPEAPQIAQQVAGHGPPVHGSSAWNQAGLSGQGIKVGVIDLPFGFNSSPLPQSAGNFLPAGAAARLCGEPHQAAHPPDRPAAAASGSGNHRRQCWSRTTGQPAVPSRLPSTKKSSLRASRQSLSHSSWLP